MNGSRIDSQHFEPFIKIKNDAGSEDVHYFSLYEGLPDEFKKYAREHLNETDENKERGLRELRAFMQKENLASVDELLLLAVLRNYKYDIKKSKHKLKRFLKQRQHAISDLARLDMRTIQAVMDELIWVMLPYRDKQGRIITYTRPNFHFENYTMTDLYVLGKIVPLFILRFPMTTVNGVGYIADCQFPLQLFYPMLKYAKPLVQFLVDCPLRIRRSDSIYAHIMARLLTAALRPLLSKKLNSRIFVHGGGCEVLDDIYHPSLRPEELGGTAGPLTDSFYRDKMVKFIEELKSEGAAANSPSKNT